MIGRLSFADGYSNVGLIKVSKCMNSFPHLCRMDHYSNNFRNDAYKPQAKMDN